MALTIAVYCGTQVIVSLAHFGEPAADYDYFAAIIAAAYDLTRLLVLTHLEVPVIETVDLDRTIAHVDQVAASSSLFADLKDNHSKINSAVDTAKVTAGKIKTGIDTAVQNLRGAIDEELHKTSAATCETSIARSSAPNKAGDKGTPPTNRTVSTFGEMPLTVACDGESPRPMAINGQPPTA